MTKIIIGFILSVILASIHLWVDSKIKKKGKHKDD